MRVELIHDTLAKKIYEKASPNDKMTAKVSQFVHKRYAHYLETDALLEQKDLDYIAPYLDKITLEEGEEDFLEFSRNSIHRKRYLMNLMTLLVGTILFLAGIQAVFKYVELEKRRQLLKRQYKELLHRQEEREIAEERAQKLLTRSVQLDERELEDITLVKQIIIQYDTIGQQHEDIRKERDVAQSATLSNLAEEAIDQEDYKYAFQLAEKAWELNKNNEQALEILEDLAEEMIEDAPVNTLEAEHDTTVIIQTLEQAHETYNVGKLQSKDLNAIFDEENIVVQQSETGIKKQVKNTKRKKKKPSKGQGIKTPGILKSIQESVAQEPLELPKLKDMLDNLDCKRSRDRINKWIPIKITKAYSLYSKYVVEDIFKFQIKNYSTSMPLPEFTTLTLFFEQTTETLPLKINENKGTLIYSIKLTEAVKALMKEQLILSIGFDPDPQIQEPVEPYKAVLSEDTQIKFQIFSKCVL